MRYAGHVARMGDRRGAFKVVVGKLSERDHLEDLDLDGMLILKWILRKSDGGVEWIDLDQDMDGWWALVNAVMNLRVP